MEGEKYRYKKIKTCKLCGEKFHPSRPNRLQTYCSYSCANKVRAKNRSEKAAETRICVGCNKPFTKMKSLFKWGHGGKYCSRKCMGVAYSNKDKKGRVSISTMKKRVWILFSKYIRNRDNWTCITCGTTGMGATMHAGHFVPRTHTNTLFDEINVHAQCAKCNMFNSGEPHVYAQKLILMYGKDEFDKLVKRGTLIKRFTHEELEFLYDKYKSLAA